MIDPSNITNFQRTDHELEEFALFCPAAAGKNSQEQAYKPTRLIALLQRGSDRSTSPFGRIAMAEGESFGYDPNQLMEAMRRSKIGKYSLLYDAYVRLCRLTPNELRTLPVEEFEKLPGFGMKTARFFVLHSRPTDDIACIDTHVLRYLRIAGLNVPNDVGSPSRYLAAEKAFLVQAGRLGIEPWRLDINVWNYMRDLGPGDTPDLDAFHESIS